MDFAAFFANGPVFLVGATGVGKSALALDWVRRQPQLKGAAILVMDAMQVYRGADVGTSKPTATERAEIPHGGLDLVDFGEPFDVARYLHHAAEFLDAQRVAGRPVLLVGGTGLYFRALTQGLCEAPQASSSLRAELSTLSVPELRVRLKGVDPGIMERIDIANPRRLARAIEVMETTARSLHSWQNETTPPIIPSFQAIWLQREKPELYARIEARIAAMLAQGWIEEVKSLIARHGLEAVRQFPAIGYRQLVDVLEGRISLSTAQSNILVATRQYAKRQLTWFAREPNLQVMTFSGSSAVSSPFPSI